MDTKGDAMKTCVKCGHEFDRRACPACAKIRVAAWRVANPERVKEYKAAWDAENKDKRVGYDAKYIAAKPDYRDAWIKANPDAVRKIKAAWLKRNKEYSRIVCQNYRAKKRANGGVLSSGLAEKLFKLQRGKCACCGKPLGTDFHLDHIYPVALGGPNTDDNIQLLRSLCNHQKCAKHPVDFMQERGFLL